MSTPSIQPAAPNHHPTALAPSSFANSISNLIDEINANPKGADQIQFPSPPGAIDNQAMEQVIRLFSAIATDISKKDLYRPLILFLESIHHTTAAQKKIREKLKREIPQCSFSFAKLPLESSTYLFQKQIAESHLFGEIFHSHPFYRLYQHENLEQARLILDNNAFLLEPQEGEFPNNLPPLQLLLLLQRNHGDYSLFFYRSEEASRAKGFIKELLSRGIDPMLGAVDEEESGEAHYHPLNELIRFQDPELLELYFANRGTLPQSKCLQNEIIDTVFSRATFTSDIHRFVSLCAVPLQALIHILLDRGICIEEKQARMIWDILNRESAFPRGDFNITSFVNLVTRVLDRYLSSQNANRFPTTTDLIRFTARHPRMFEILFCMDFDPSREIQYAEDFQVTEHFSVRTFEHYISFLMKEKNFQTEELFPVILAIYKKYMQGANTTWQRKDNPLMWTVLPQNKTVWEALEDVTRRELLREGCSPTD